VTIDRLRQPIKPEIILFLINFGPQRSFQFFTLRQIHLAFKDRFLNPLTVTLTDLGHAA